MFLVHYFAAKQLEIIVCFDLERKITDAMLKNYLKQMTKMDRKVQRRTLSGPKYAQQRDLNWTKWT